MSENGYEEYLEEQRQNEEKEHEYLESQAAGAEASAKAQQEQEDTKEYPEGKPPKDIFWPEESRQRPKRYFFSVVEEGVMNPDYAGYRGGRIEVMDSQSNSEHPVYEASFLLPEEFYEAFRETFDWKESDLEPRIVWDHKENAL